jgi:DNA-binding transcriptional ArsR family regulator
MSKTGDTKRQIVEYLKFKKGTLTDISHKLNLAPSTVSQHLKELLQAGEIRLADDKPRKWKYYQINSGPVSSPYQAGFQMKSIIIPIAGVILIAVLAIGLYHSGNVGFAAAQQVYIAPGSAVPTGSTVFSLSDSPQFYNVSALFITVTNASVQSTSGKWYSIPLQEHTFNLVSLRNISEIMSGVNLSYGSYDALSFSVSNVTAIVNGTSRSVFLPNGKLFVVGRFNVSANSTNWVNIDFNLERSLHLESNGSLVMLPVLLISHQTCNQIGLNASSIVVARSSPEMHEDFEFGMDANGSMRDNFTFPQNGVIAVSAGKVRYRGEGPPQFVIRTRRGFVMGPNATWFFGYNAMNESAEANGPIQRPFAAALNINGSANSTAVVCPRMGVCHGPMILPPMIPGIRSGEAINGSGSGNYASGWSNYTGNATGHWLISVPPGVINGENSSGYVNCDFRNGGVACVENDSFNATPVTGRLVINGGSCAGLRPGEC